MVLFFFTLACFCHNIVKRLWKLFIFQGYFKQRLDIVVLVQLTLMLCQPFWWMGEQLIFYLRIGWFLWKMFHSFILLKFNQLCFSLQGRTAGDSGKGTKDSATGFTILSEKKLFLGQKVQWMFPYIYIKNIIYVYVKNRDWLWDIVII